MISNKIYSFLTWFLAFMLSLFIINALCFPYHRFPGWIDRERAATKSIWNPGSTIVMGTEGYGIHHIDYKGYVNDEKPINDHYYLAVGSSYTQGKEVRSGERYSDLLNAWLSPDNETLSVYNLSQDGFYFPDIIHHFNCIIAEFPNPEGIIIFTNSLAFDDKERDYMLSQEIPDAAQNGENIVSTLSIKKRLSIIMKEITPALTLFRQQMKLLAVKYPKENETGDMDKNNDVRFDEVRYADMMNKALSLIRSEYSGRIIIVYAQSILPDKNGDIIVNLPKSYASFKRCCMNNDIEFVDTTEAMIIEYKERHVLPYGHMNTSPIRGHFNKNGHYIVASELYKAIVNQK